MSDIKKRWKAHQFDWLTMAEQDTEKQFYVCLNQQEMAMILGALTPTMWRTRWLNLPNEQDFQWIVELRAKLLCSNGCCDGVEECIRDSEGIREIIREIIKETTIADPARPIGGDNPVFDSCNPDVIFGAVTSLVDYLNGTILDALQIMEVATNPLEAINLWADNIPIAGRLASGLVEAIEFILENVAENYDANYTIALRDQYRCDLFCMWRDSEDCDLTPAMVAGYFADRIGSPDPLGQLNDVLQFIFTGIWAGSQIVDLMHLIALGSLVAVDKIGFFDAANAYTFTVAVALGANSPDPDWSILCECANEWCYKQDFALNDGGYVQLPGAARGVYTVSVGWTETNRDGVCGAWIGRTIAESNVTGVRIVYDLTGGSGRRARVILRNNGATVATLSYGTEQGIDIVKTSSGDWTVDEVWINIDADDAGGCGVGDEVAIKELTLSGEGENPFGADNC